MHVWSSLQETGNLLSLKGDLDLAAPLPACDRLTLRKGKAHNLEGTNAMATTLLRLTTDGNEAADLAAKQTLTQESGHVLQAAEEVFNHYQVQQSHMEFFAEFLVDISVMEVRRKEAVQCGDDSSQEYDAARAVRNFFARFASTVGQYADCEACHLVTASCLCCTGGGPALYGRTYLCRPSMGMPSHCWRCSLVLA